MVPRKSDRMDEKYTKEELAILEHAKEEMQSLIREAYLDGWDEGFKAGAKACGNT